MNEFERKRRERVKWFERDRLGMFIHWGAYANAGRNEWVRYYETLSNDDYQKYVERFCPTDFNPEEWAEVAKRSGLKYAILTARHHDGFCMFDSKYTDYKVTNSAYGKDIVRQFVEAFRAKGIKVGLYYSLIDWHHPDFPHYGDVNDPMRANKAYEGKGNLERYRQYLYNQVEELVSNYGNLDLFWFDFSYGDMVGEKWGATKLTQLIRSHQPNILINNRLEVGGEGHGSLLSDNPTDFAGDFFSPEQIIPPKIVTNASGDKVTWEVCATLNNSWGYVASDNNYKTSDFIIRKIVECISKNGNMLLNVAPDAKGRLSKEAVSLLEEVGDWLRINGESVYGCHDYPCIRPDWGRYTTDGRYLYAHILEPTLGPMPLYGIPKGKASYAESLATGAEVEFSKSWICNNFPDYDYLTPVIRDKTDNIIKIELK